jgi:hypothetical protein
MGSRFDNAQEIGVHVPGTIQQQRRQGRHDQMK